MLPTDPSCSTARMSEIVRIGTRASKLALAQSGMMQRRIAGALGGEPDEVAPLVHITTTGDRVQDRRLLEVGGKALFTKEIEEALLNDQVDVAVHSMKDVPAEQPPGLVIAAVPVVRSAPSMNAANSPDAPLRMWKSR